MFNTSGLYHVAHPGAADHCAVGHHLLGHKLKPDMVLLTVISQKGTVAASFSSKPELLAYHNALQRKFLGQVIQKVIRLCICELPGKLDFKRFRQTEALTQQSLFTFSKKPRSQPPQDKAGVRSKCHNTPVGMQFFSKVSGILKK